MATSAVASELAQLVAAPEEGVPSTAPTDPVAQPAYDTASVAVETA